jgi:nucleoside-triphosphatase THEP1
MKGRLFLTGPIGCGKTTILRTALGENVATAGGFSTERTYDGDGAHTGFILMRASELALPPARRSGRRFLIFEQDGSRRDDAVFTEYAAAILREAAFAPFALLDELGGFELMLPDFEAALHIFLQTDVPTIGVLKAIPSAKNLTKRLNLTDAYLNRAYQLLHELEADPGTTVLRTTGRYDEAAKAAVNEWVKCFATK